MESAHLTKAHEHARSAATATVGKSIATAGQEHHLAATAFHDAAQDTHNAEALRILGLLEEHHYKLAGLIKEAPRKKDKNDSTTQPSDASVSSASLKASTSRNPSSSASSPTPPTSRRRLPQSNIASNLAEKRGIPTARRTNSGALLSVVGATTGKSEAASTPVRDLLAQQSRKADPTASPRDSPKQADTPPQPTPLPAEENFRRFYSAFGGIISAISAPLAFTSLPLNPIAPTPVSVPAKDERTPKTKSRAQSPEAARTVKSSVPDLASLISKPALRALRADGAPPLGPNESFYLVPTAGGTVTYASVLRDPNAPNLQQNATDEGSGSLKGSSHEEFVDARESVGPPSPTKARRPLSRGNSNKGVTPQRTIPAGRGAGLKTMEELVLENETLRTAMDKQSKRIQMWETNSQNSYNVLAQSFRARGPGSGGSNSDPKALAHALSLASTQNTAHPAMSSPPIPSFNANQHPHPSSPHLDTSDPATAKRITDLEALLANQNAKVEDLMTNNESLAKQNERNAQVLGRYREQWEKLKAGARKKEAERREKGKVEEMEKGKEGVSEGGGGNGAGDEENGLEEPGFGKA